MKKRNILLAGFLSLALMLAGCGSNTGDTASGSSEGETIKIGWYGPLTGYAATDGTNSLKGAQLAIDQFNAAGGLDGKKIKLVAEDDQGKPEEAIKAVQKLINKDQVTAIIDGAYSGSSKTAAGKVQEAKVPMVVSIATHPDITKGGKYINRVIYTGPVQGEAMAKYAIQDLKLKNIAVLYVEADYGTSIFGAFKSKVEELQGKIVYESSFRFGDKDYSSLLTSVKMTNPDALYIVGYYNEAAGIANQVKEVGLKVPLLGVDGLDTPKYPELAKANAEGTLLTTSFYVKDQRPVVKDFVAEWTKAHTDEPSMVASQSYDAALVIINALKKAGEDREKLADVISQTKDLEGTSGKISFAEDHEVIKPVTFVEVKDGKFEFVIAK